MGQEQSNANYRETFFTVDLPAGNQTSQTRTWVFTDDYVRSNLPAARILQVLVLLGLMDSARRRTVLDL